MAARSCVRTRLPSLPCATSFVFRSAEASRSKAGTSRRLKSTKIDTHLPPATALRGRKAVEAAARQDYDPITGEKTGSNDIDPSALIVEETSAPKSAPANSELIFGRTFTDHMLVIPWSAEAGWSPPRIIPYGPLQLDPSATVLHYATTLFEGMKAFKDKQGRVRLFRPEKNMERMNSSAARLAFPGFSPDHLITLMKRLLALDKDWIPAEPGYSLYIRPTMIGTQQVLGVGPSSEVLLFVICSPVGPYYKTGFKPVNLLATTEHVRAWPGGTGNYKLGLNYTAGVVPQVQAAEMGYQQILWLYGPEHELTEVGTMNMFAVFAEADGGIEVVTPPLGDIILPGVVRDSTLQLLRAHSAGKDRLPGLPDKVKISERKLKMAEVIKASDDGSLLEMFGTGTAAVVSTVEGIGFQDQRIEIPVGSDGLGDVSRAIQRRLEAINYGEIESDWSVIVE